MIKCNETVKCPDYLVSCDKCERNVEKKEFVHSKVPFDFFTDRFKLMVKSKDA